MTDYIPENFVKERWQADRAEGCPEAGEAPSVRK